MHHIRRQRWQLKTNDRTTAFALRSSLRRDLDALTMAFDRGFGAVDDDNEIIHIPKLELHLRISNVDDLLQHLPAVLAAQLGQALLQTDKQGTQLSRRISKSVEAHQILLRYLHSGNLDWSALSFDAPGLIVQLTQVAQIWLAPA